MLGEHYVSVSARFLSLLGDFTDQVDSTPLPPDEQELLLQKCMCKIQGIIDKLPDNYKVFVASDSRKFLSRAAALPNVYVVDGEISHMGYSASDDAIMKTFVDLMLLRGAEKRYLLQSGDMFYSGFPRLASWIGNGKFQRIRF